MIIIIDNNQSMKTTDLIIAGKLEMLVCSGIKHLYLFDNTSYSHEAFGILSIVYTKL